MSIQIAPSLLSADFAHLDTELKQLEKDGADRIHLDVMDGHFVPNITFGAPVIKKLRASTSILFEAHLMISPYESYLQDFIDAGSDLIMIHPEADGNIKRALKFIRSKGKKSGLVLNPETPLGIIEPYLDHIDQLLIMTVKPGFGGQGFREDQLDKIKAARILIGDRNIDLEVDGGITKETAPLCIAAGASILVAGTSVFKTSNYKKNMNVIRNPVTPYNPLIPAEDILPQVPERFQLVKKLGQGTFSK